MFKQSDMFAQTIMHLYVPSATYDKDQNDEDNKILRQVLVARLSHL